MTPESAERLSAWRAEIVSEIAAAKKELPAMEAEHATAIAAARTAETAYSELQQLLDQTYKVLASPLATRIAWLRSAVDEAKAGATRAEHALKTARGRVTEIERALRQLDHLIHVEEPEAEAA